MAWCNSFPCIFLLNSSPTDKPIKSFVFLVVVWQGIYHPSQTQEKDGDQEFILLPPQPDVLPRSDVVVVVVYPTPSEGWGHGGRPWSPRSRATPQGLDQRS